MKRDVSQVVMLLAKPYAVDTRVRNEARSLSSVGLHVVVLSWNRSGFGPDDTTTEGVRVKGLRLLGGTDFSRLAYALSAILLQFYCVLWCIRNMRGRYFVHANDFNTLPAGVMLKILRPGSVRLVYDCHELTPSAYAEWYGLGIGLTAGAIERILLRFADTVLTVSPPIKDYLSKASGGPVSVIVNTIEKESVPRESKEALRKRFGLDGLVVSYVGSLRRDVGLDELVGAARHFKEAGVEGIRFVIVGSGPDLARIKGEAAGLDGYVTFVSQVSHAEALRYVRASDVSYAVYRPTPRRGSDERNTLVSQNTNVASPWKVFEAMACGTCVLVRSGTYAWELVNGLGFGIPAGSGTAEDIVKSLAWALKNRTQVEAMADSASAHFYNEYNWNRMAERLADAYGLPAQNRPAARTT